MRRIIVSTYATLDGSYADPTEWSFQYFDDAAMKYARELLFSSDVLVMGRKTYESFAEAWTTREDEFADRFNAMTKYVASTTLSGELPWNNARVLEGDLVEEVARLKQQPGENIIIYGTGPVAIELMKAGLVDEHHTWIHPIIWGGDDERLFDGLERVTLEVVDTTVTPSGIVITNHRPAAG